MTRGYEATISHLIPTTWIEGLMSPQKEDHKILALLASKTPTVELLHVAIFTNMD